MSSSFEILLFCILAALFVAGIGALIFFSCRQKNKPAEAPPPPYGKVRFDEKEIVFHRENDERITLTWEELTKLRILTTPDGPFLPDIFWVFESDESIAMKIPSETEGMSDLSSRLTSLEDFQSDAMIEAMSSTDYASFELWKRTPSASTF